MFCKKCGKKNYDDAKFCYSCGCEFPVAEGCSPLDETIARPVDQPAAEPALVPTYRQPTVIPRQKRSGKAWAIAMCAALSVLFCAGTVFFAVKYFSLKSDMALPEAVVSQVLPTQQSTETVETEKEEFEDTLLRTQWQFSRHKTVATDLAGPAFETNADYADEYVVTLTFQEDKAMVTRYVPRFGGDSLTFEAVYIIDGERALIRNDDLEYEGNTYEYYTEYALSDDGNLVSRGMLVDLSSKQYYYFGNSCNIYRPVD